MHPRSGRSWECISKWLTFTQLHNSPADTVSCICSVHLRYNTNFSAFKYQPLLISIWNQHATETYFHCLFCGVACSKGYIKWLRLITQTESKSQQQWYCHLLCWNVNCSHLLFISALISEVLDDVRYNPTVIFCLILDQYWISILARYSPDYLVYIILFTVSVGLIREFNPLLRAEGSAWLEASQNTLFAVFNIWNQTWAL